MTKDGILGRLLDPGVIAIVRAKSGVPFTRVAESLYEGGIRAIEITLTTPGAMESLAAVPAGVHARMAVGVGTVLSVEQAEAAVKNGACFVVTPVLRLDVVAYCVRKRMPIACGAYSPSEAQMAHEAGADFVKLFPADGLGPDFVRAVLAPLPHLRIIPTGGVTEDTCADFLRAGCVAVAAGSSLIDPALVNAGDWTRLTEKAGAFVAAARLVERELRR